MEVMQLKTRDFDLEQTLTCGQTFCWHRFEGDLYSEGSEKFYSFRKGELLIVETTDEGIRAKTDLPRKEVKRALGIDHSLQDIFEQFPDDRKIEKARTEFSGLRVLQDEFFPCTISYIMSSQMRIPRIKEMFNTIAAEYGEKEVVEGREFLKFPDREQLKQASEEELRDIGVGYRAPYIVETMEIFEQLPSENELREMGYEDAKKELKKLQGVGDKVADCILLFSLGFHEATPLDTWAKKAVKAHYPEIHSEKYEDVSENLREHFGPKAGYATEYLFHAARQGVLET